MSLQKGLSTSLEAVIIFPFLILVLGAIVAFARIELTKQSLSSAASDAARVISLARSANVANDEAKKTLDNAIKAYGINCSKYSYTVDTSGFNTVVGTPSFIKVYLNCEVSLSDVALPGLPGTKSLKAQAKSPIDTYRQR